MKGVEGRNVTQMASLMQDLVESQLFGDGVTETNADVKLDSDISDALKTIKALLLGDIQKALVHEHGNDQHSVNVLHKCWDSCKSAAADDQAQVDEMWGNMQRSKTGHETCRTNVLTLYEDKVKKCNALDVWIAGLECPACFKEECQVIRDPNSRKIGDMLQAHIAWASASYAEWQIKHTACAAAVRAYADADTVCDKTQGGFESDTCAHRQATWTACNVNQMTCCKRCSIEFDAEVNRVECAEKDRKIDWSATKKIECYIDVLMASPTDEELQAKCKADGKACINQWREAKYKSCEEVCVDVDFEAGDYYMVDGVNTTHRSDSSEGDRCTRHLDIHFPAMPACTKCPPPLPGPCEWTFVSNYYAEYDSLDGINSLADAKACAPDVHTKKWGYSRAECRPCPELIGRSPNSEPSCFFGNQVRIFATEATKSFLNLGEVIVNGGEKMKVTISDSWAAPHLKDNCVDGRDDTFCHSGSATGWWVAFTLDTPTCINTIEVRNRHNCCQDRIVGAGISILNQGTEIWTDTFDVNMMKYKWNLAGSQVQDNCEGWSVDTKHMVDGTCYLGAFDNKEVKKTFSGLNPTCTYKWSAMIDTWASVDNEPMTFTLNGQSHSFGTRGAGDCANGWTQYPHSFGTKVGSPGSAHGAWKDCYKKFETEFIAPPTGIAEVTMHAALNQHINDEAWGFHDMSFELVKCGTVVDDGQGWSVGNKHMVDGTLYLGAFSMNQHPRKVFSGLSEGCTYKMSAVIDTWASTDNERMDFTINGQKFNFGGRSGGSCNNGWKEYPHAFGVKVGSPGSANKGWPDCFKEFSATFKAPETGLADVTMHVAVDQHINDEAWGWHNMVIEQMSC